MLQNFSNNNSLRLQPRNLILLDFIPFVSYPNVSSLSINSLSSTVLKYVDRIFYKDDNTPFTNEDPCFNNAVSDFLLVENEVVGNNLNFFKGSVQ